MNQKLREAFGPRQFRPGTEHALNALLGTILTQNVCDFSLFCRCFVAVLSLFCRCFLTVFSPFFTVFQTSDILSSRSHSQLLKAFDSNIHGPELRGADFHH